MHGLDIMNIKTGKVIRHYNAGPGPHELKNDFIVTLFQTHSGDILIGTWKGLFRYNRQSDDFSPVPFFDAPIQALWEDEAGNFMGLYTGQWRYLLQSPDKTNRLFII